MSDRTGAVKVVREIEVEGGVPQEVVGMIEISLVGAAYRDEDGKLQTGFFMVEHPRGEPRKAIFHKLADKIMEDLIHIKATDGLNKNLLPHYLRLRGVAAPTPEKEPAGGKADQL